MATPNVAVDLGVFVFIVALDNGPSYYTAEASELGFPVPDPERTWPGAFDMGGHTWFMRAVARKPGGDVQHIDYWRLDTDRTVVRVFND